LRAEEVEGQHFLNLDIGLVEQLLQPIRTYILGETECPKVTLEALNRRGRVIQCQVICTPLIGTEKEILMMLMEEKANAES